MLVRKPRMLRAKRSAIALAAVTATGAWIGLQQSGALATPPATTTATAATTASTPATATAHRTPTRTEPAPRKPATAPSASGSAGAATAADPNGPSHGTAVPTTATIVFTTMPAANATVTWGKTRLGRIKPGKPLVVVRPRDSGPLDVIISAPGFLPVHTRAHTFTDSKMLVKLTRPEEKNTLLGYRQPLDAGIPFPEDGGVPPTTDVPPALSPLAPVSDAPAPLANPLSPMNVTAPLMHPVPPAQR